MFTFSTGFSSVSEIVGNGEGGVCMRPALQNTLVLGYWVISEHLRK